MPSSHPSRTRLDQQYRSTRFHTLSRVYDSGSLLETISAAQLPALFNSEGTTDSKDKRSDNKGPEPEGVVRRGTGSRGEWTNCSLASNAES